MTKVLDCTLRDGGYYNDWHFPLEIARRTIDSLSQAGVDIIEVGLKSAFDEQCSGLFKYCNEDYLDFLGAFPNVQFSFMVNVKEFVRDGKVDEAALDRIIRPADESHFGLCRMAAHYADIEHVAAMTRYFRGEGYAVGINLMGISLLDDDQIADAMTRITALKPEVFYVADSFGSMLPEDVSALVRNLRKHYQGSLGIHTHDNQGLAFANSLRAIDEGIEYIDATLTGMGRGAGNLFTEQILLWLQNRGDQPSRYHSSRLLEIINDFYAPLKQRFGWGFNYVYMMSGLNNTHPVYCMELCDGNRFSLSRISHILQQIPRESRASFNRAVLDQAINQAPADGGGSDTDTLPRFKASSYQATSDSCLIVSTGPGVEDFAEPMASLLSRRDMDLIECNDTGILQQFPERLGIVLNSMRLLEIAKLDQGLPGQIITGERLFGDPINTNLSHLPFQIGELQIESDGVVIPDFEAGQYAIAIAIALGYQNLHLAGFVGYPEKARNAVMEQFLKSVQEKFPLVKLTLVTPSQYEGVAHRSIYTL